MLLFPIGIKDFKHFLVVLEHCDEIRIKIFRLVENVAFVIAFFQRLLYNLVQLHSFGLQVFYIKVWSNDDFVLSKHL